MLHISELADHKVENPQDVVNVGDDIEVKILRVDSEERKIGLSRKRVEWAEEDEAAAAAAEAAEAGEVAPKADSADLKGGIGSDSGPLFKSAAVAEEQSAPAEAPAEAPAAEAETAEAAPAEAAESAQAEEAADAEEKTDANEEKDA